MPDTWIADTLPPCSGVYDVTLHLTSRRGRRARCAAVAYWPGRRSKRWDLLDLSVFDGVVIAWRPRPAPFLGDYGAPLGIVMPAELGG